MTILCDQGEHGEHETARSEFGLSTIHVNEGN